MPLLLFFLLAISLGCDKHSVGFGAHATLVLSGERPDAHFGAAGSLIGDVNGDGYDDLAIGAPGDSRNGNRSGSVYLYFGSSSGIVSSNSVLLVGGLGDEFGSSVAGLGDINGDGVEDFAVSAKKGMILGAPTQSIVYIFFGGASEFTSDRTANTAPIAILSQTLQELLVSSAGDLDQNGTLDLGIGAPSENRVYVFFSGSLFPGAPRPLLTQADLKLRGTNSSKFGASLSAAGDVNGQNVGSKSRFGDDLLIGAPSEENKGAVYLVLGSAGFPRGEININSVAERLSGSSTGDEFGAAVAGIGDFDQDGFGDIAIGAPGNLGGRVEIYFGKSLVGVSTNDPTFLTAEFPDDRLGASVTGFLPHGLSGMFPVAVGAPGSNFTGPDSGSVFIFSSLLFGSDAFPRGASVNAASADVKIRNPMGGVGGAPQMGSQVHGGLDLNGDTKGDLFIGIPGVSSSGSDAGGAFILW